jgi:protein tyrosine/serine phosphatase
MHVCPMTTMTKGSARITTVHKDHRNITRKILLLSVQPWPDSTLVTGIGAKNYLKIIYLLSAGDSRL